MTALAAQFSDFKLIKTRKVVQLIFEVSSERAQEAFDLLGWPDPHAERWVGIAPLNGNPNAEPEVEKPRKSWSELSRPQQAGILCADMGFQKYLKVGNQETAADQVRFHCRVASRAELENADGPARAWDNLVAAFRRWEMDAYNGQRS